MLYWRGRATYVSATRYASSFDQDILTILPRSGWFTWTCSCNNPATKQTYSMSPLCEQAGGKIEGNTVGSTKTKSRSPNYAQCLTQSSQCTFQADNDLNGPTIFTNDKCAAQYGASYHGSCSMEGFYSICPGPGGCPITPTQQSDCPASAGVPNFCAASPQCVESQLRCDFGDLGYCIWGACQCTASGWTVTGKVATIADCSNQHFPLL